MQHLEVLHGRDGLSDGRNTLGGDIAGGHVEIFPLRASGSQRRCHSTSGSRPQTGGFEFHVAHVWLLVEHASERDATLFVDVVIGEINFVERGSRSQTLREHHGAIRSVPGTRHLEILHVGCLSEQRGDVHDTVVASHVFVEVEFLQGLRRSQKLENSSSGLLRDTVVDEADALDTLLLLQHRRARANALLAESVIAHVHGRDVRAERGFGDDLHGFQGLVLRATRDDIAEVHLLKSGRDVRESLRHHVGSVDAETLRAESHLRVRRAFRHQRREHLLRARLSVKLAILAHEVEVVGVSTSSLLSGAGVRRSLAEALRLSLDELSRFLDV